MKTMLLLALCSAALAVIPMAGQQVMCSGMVVVQPEYPHDTMHVGSEIWIWSRLGIWIADSSGVIVRAYMDKSGKWSSKNIAAHEPLASAAGSAKVYYLGTDFNADTISTRMTGVGSVA
jgi:hypothetical protein